MSVKYAVYGLIWAASGAVACAETPKLPYPPADAPLYMECKLRGINDQRPYANWDRLFIYFPDGTRDSLLHVEFVDPKNQLGGAKFSFTMKNESSWSIYAIDRVPRSEQLALLPRVVFLPPSGDGETLKIGYAIGRDVQKLGDCFGLIGPDTKNAFEKAKKDSSSVDKQ